MALVRRTGFLRLQTDQAIKVALPGDARIGVGVVNQKTPAPAGPYRNAWPGPIARQVTRAGSATA
ncbi:MAG: hypothetical protein AB7G13_19735 [Lautropia sp.]